MRLGFVGFMAFGMQSSRAKGLGLRVWGSGEGPGL